MHNSIENIHKQIMYIRYMYICTIIYIPNNTYNIYIKKSILTNIKNIYFAYYAFSIAQNIA